MHHLDLGLFHYQIEYTRQLIKDQHGNSFVNEIDHRLATIPRFSGLKIFSNGIQSIARLTASEYRDLMKVGRRSVKKGEIYFLVKIYFIDPLD